MKQEGRHEDNSVKRRRTADGDRQFRDDKRQKVFRALRSLRRPSQLTGVAASTHLPFLCRPRPSKTGGSEGKSCVLECRPRREPLLLWSQTDRLLPPERTIRY